MRAGGSGAGAGVQVSLVRDRGWNGGVWGSLFMSGGGGCCSFCAGAVIVPSCSVRKGVGSPRSLPGILLGRWFLSEVETRRVQNGPEPGWERSGSPPGGCVAPQLPALLAAGGCGKAGEGRSLTGL